MDDKEQVVSAGLEQAPPKRKRATATRKRSAVKPAGRKTLIAAVVAALLALADLFLTVRLGIKLF